MKFIIHYFTQNPQTKHRTALWSGGYEGFFVIQTLHPQRMNAYATCSRRVLHRNSCSMRVITQTDVRTVNASSSVDPRADLAVGGVLWPACGRIFEIELAAVRRSIEERLRAGQPFDAALERCIRMIDGVAETEKDAHSLPFATLVRHLHVVVEVAFVRRIKRKANTTACPMRLKLCIRCACNDHETRIALLQIRQIGKTVHESGTHRATDVVLGTIHEVIHDQLPLARKHLREGDIALGTDKPIRLVHVHHRQSAALRCDPIVRFGQGFFFDQQRRTGRLPGVARHNRWVGDLLLHICSFGTENSMIIDHTERDLHYRIFERAKSSCIV